MLDKEKKFSLDAAKDKAAALCALLGDKKAADILALDVTAMTPEAEVMIIATSRSARHAQALADHVLAFTAEHNYEMLGMEGYKSGLWILVDLNDILVHLFQAPVRDLFNLEGLWSEALELCRIEGGDGQSHGPLADYGDEE